MLLAVAARTADYLLRRRSVEVRYALYVTALIGCLVTLPLTFAIVDVPALAPATRLPGNHGQAFQDANADEPELIVARGAAGNQFRSRPPRTANPQAVVSLSTPDGAADSERASIARVPEWYRWSLWIVGLYVTGVLVMLARLAGGIWTSRRLRLRAETIHEGPLVDLLRTVANGWSMHVVPTLARAQEIVVPQVVGFIRPTILLPVSATTALSLDELEMILAHELAHVRRYDLWVNLLQRLAETTLFFNPAVWYLSRRISTLREYCCDEMVCEAMAETQPQPQACYASALLRVAELGRQNTSPQSPVGEHSELAALAASGRSPSELRRRVAHLFGEPLREPFRMSKGSLLTLAILLASLLVIGPATWPLAADAETTLSADGLKNASENDFGAVTDAQDNQTLRFPEDRAVGVVYSRPEKDSGFGFRDDWYGNWQQVARARGKVSLPVGHHIRLDVAKAASRDLNFLDDLDPGVVESLFLEGTDVNDEQLKHIGHLTSLRFLDLSQTRISDRGFQHLANLRKLQRLDLSAHSVNRMGFGVGDGAMAVVAKLPALETISLRLTKVTNRGLPLLAECKSLRAISLAGTSVTGAGLEHLMRLSTWRT